MQKQNRNNLMPNRQSTLYNNTLHLGEFFLCFVRATTTFHISEYKFGQKRDFAGAVMTQSENGQGYPRQRVRRSEQDEARMFRKQRAER